jgi:hypothetical protein
MVVIIRRDNPAPALRSASIRASFLMSELRGVLLRYGVGHFFRSSSYPRHRFDRPSVDSVISLCPARSLLQGERRPCQSEQLSSEPEKLR